MLWFLSRARRGCGGKKDPPSRVRDERVPHAGCSGTTCGPGPLAPHALLAWGALLTLQFAASQAMTLLACAAEEQQEGGGALVQGVGPRPEALPHHTRPHTLRSAHLERLHHLLPQARRIKLLAVLLEIGGGAGQLLLRVCVCVCVWRRIAKARMHACTHACMHIAHPLPASFSVSAPPCAPPPPRGWAPVPLRARWRQSPAARAAAPPGRGACCGCTCRPVVREEGGGGSVRCSWQASA